MTTVKQQLIALIQEHKEELIARTSNKLQKFTPSHYESVAYEQHLKREEWFLNVLLQTLQDDTCASLPAYVKQLGEERANEGYDLQELEEAFDIVEDTIWEVVTKYCPLEYSLLDMLALVRKFIREAKNSIGQHFLDEALTTQQHLHDMLGKFAEYRHKKHE